MSGLTPFISHSRAITLLPPFSLHRGPTAFNNAIDRLAALDDVLERALANLMIQRRILRPEFEQPPR
jgi:hypothetical protein